MAEILLVDDQLSVLTSLSILLKRQGHGVTAKSNGAEAQELMVQRTFDLILTDLRMKRHHEGMEVLRCALEIQPDVPVIIMTGHGTIDNAVEAIKMGAFDYITKGFTNQEFLDKVDRALQQGRWVPVKNGESHDQRPSGFDQIIGQSPGMLRILQLVEKIAPSDSAILIQGESGTGKELIAKAIHRRSRRAHRPFVAINCGAFPDNLLESELFGHLRGSFTGATHDKEGLFVSAHQGTLFLDEVCEMSHSMQIKLLRVLQDWVVRPLGSTAGRPVDVRIISATNRDLLKAIDKGVFREDLYFRLCVVPIRIPPLRERKEDIPVLIKAFLSQFSKKYHKPPLQLEPGALEALSRQPWRGNVRELENFLERLNLLFDQTPVSAKDIKPHLSRHSSEDSETRSSLAGHERTHILSVLIQCHWNQSEAARRLGIGRTTLWRKMKAYHIRNPLEGVS